MSTKFVPPSEGFPKGRFFVNVQVRRGGHRERWIDCSEYRTIGKAEREAQALERRLISELESDRARKDSEAGKKPVPVLPVSNVETFAQVLNNYRTAPTLRGPNRGKIRRLTRDESRFNRLLRDLGDFAPWEVEHRLTEVCTKWLEDEELEESTVNRHITMAKCAMKVAYKTRIGGGPERARMIPEFYLEDFSLFDENNIRYRILSDDERKKLWKNLGEVYQPLQWLYYLALSVPIRMSELVNIKLSDCRQVEGCIVIPRTKAGPARTIRMPEVVQHRLSRLHPTVTYLHADEHGNPLGYYSEREGRLIFSQYEEFRAALTKSGIPYKGDVEKGIVGYNFHKTRQEAAMLAYQDGSTEDEIMLRGGWHSKEAFKRYFNDELAMEIRSGTFKIGTEWREHFKADLRKVA